MKNKNTLKTVIEFTFLLFVFILVIMIRLGIDQDFTQIKTTEFWIETSAQFALTMVTFNLIFNFDKNNTKHDKSSRFFKAYATNKLRIKQIESNKWHNQLDKAVEKLNQELLEEKCNILLHRVCTRIDYADVMNEIVPEEGEPYFIKTTEELLDECRVLPKRRKKLEKIINKIRAGAVHIHKVKSEMFLKDKELIFSKKHAYDYSAPLQDIKHNLKKATSFIIITLVLATISISFVSPDILETIISNIVLVLMAMCSGFTSAKNEIKKETAVYENRNAFMSQYLDIDVEYTENVEKKEEKDN